MVFDNPVDYTTSRARRVAGAVTISSQLPSPRLAPFHLFINNTPDTVVRQKLPLRPAESEVSPFFQLRSHVYAPSHPPL
jgi:hypothetical protein